MAPLFIENPSRNKMSSLRAYEQNSGPDQTHKQSKDDEPVMTKQNRGC